MALVSPGVEVTVIDQSQYLPSASSSVPLIVLATAQSKANAAGTAIAAATTKSTANKLYQVTSQRDLVTLYGNPFFYKTTNGTPIHGYELNEYGLLAAYSLLASTNRAYILRADIDLADFVGSISRPSGEPDNGTYWLDTTNTAWGIFEFNASTGEFTNKVPYVLNDNASVSGGKPKDIIGNIGDYAVLAYPQALSTSSYFFKTRYNTWVAVGGSEWLRAIPTVTGTVSDPGLNAGDTFTITIPSKIDASGTVLSKGTITVTVPVSPQNNVGGVATSINNSFSQYVEATVISGKLSITCTMPATDEVKSPNITIAAGSGTVLTSLGITAKTYYAPLFSVNTSARMPLWTASQNQPRPTGSVWLKTSTSGNGLNINLSKYNVATGSYTTVNVPVYRTDDVATASLDSSGGASIPKDTVFAQTAEIYDPSQSIVLWKRLATGATVVTGTVASSVITSGNQISVIVSTPGLSPLPWEPQGTVYTFTNTGTTLDSFITDWQAARVPFTTITKTSADTVQISHTLGGQIYINTRNTSTGVTSSILTSLGIIGDVTTGVKTTGYWPFINSNADVTATSGGGTLAEIGVRATNYAYVVTGIYAGGTGYAVGDEVTISGNQLAGSSPANDLKLTVTAIGGSGSITEVVVKSGVPVDYKIIELSNWVPLDYTANEGAPVVMPADGKHWFYSTPTQVDIMVKKGTQWLGYKNVAFDASGHPAGSNSGAGQTNPTGPIISPTMPSATTGQDDGTPLVYGDLWIDSGDLENYPMIYRWKDVKGIPQWVLVDKTDQVSSEGIIFEDARWATTGSVDPVQDPIPTISSLLTSNHLDLDAPNPALYPQGMLLLNTRRSGYNVKRFVKEYFTGKDFPNAGSYDPSNTSSNTNLPLVSHAWVSASGLKADGSAYMGRKAQRAMVVAALKVAIGTNQTIREEDNFFNLIATPGYPELMADMVALNNDRHNTGYVVGDTPLRLADQATSLTNWATNAAFATSSGEDGMVTRDSYLGVFYPSGITTDLSGSPAVVPSSHMMLRTLLRNDTIAYPWLAPAGVRRGNIDNATNIGYLDSITGEFQVIKNRMSIRDVLYANQINPLAFFTGVGLLNYGNKNSQDTQSSLDRINVARLVAYIRERLQVAARPFVFEPNDSLTRQQIAGVVESLFIDLVAKRGLYDYLVVCDSTNNTPSRIDRNELWIDIAVEPVKAAEFIYIPVRLLNTGALGQG
jgi:hypothetical protein